MRLGHGSRHWLAAAGLVAVVLCGPMPAMAADKTEGYDPGNLGQAIASLVIFVLLLLVLRKWAWRPIIGELRRREKEISDLVDKAKQREQEAGDLVTMYKVRLQRAELEAEDLIADTRKEAAKAREEIVSAARDEAHQGAEKAREAIERAKQSALRDLQVSTAELAAEIASKIIQQKLTPEEQRRLLEQSLREIKKQTRKG